MLQRGRCRHHEHSQNYRSRIAYPFHLMFIRAHLYEYIDSQFYINHAKIVPGPPRKDMIKATIELTLLEFSPVSIPLLEDHLGAIPPLPDHFTKLNQ